MEDFIDFIDKDGNEYVLKTRTKQRRKEQLNAYKAITNDRENER